MTTHFKETESGDYELIVAPNEVPSVEMVLRISGKGYVLTNVEKNVPVFNKSLKKNELKDIYYFFRPNPEEEDEYIPEIDLVKECHGAEITVVLHFDKLESGNSTPEEYEEIIDAIGKALEEIGEYPDYDSGGRVNVTTEDPGKVSEILKIFGW